MCSAADDPTTTYVGWDGREYENGDQERGVEPTMHDTLPPWPSAADPETAYLAENGERCPVTGEVALYGPFCGACGRKHDARQHGPAVASWPGYTPQAQAYELATRGPDLADGLPHEFGEPCECEGCQWPDYDAKEDA